MTVEHKKNKREEYTLFKYKQLIELFVKNATLALYESIEDYLDDHTFLVKFEDQLKEYINDDDIDGCQQFYHFQNIRNRVATNAEIFENKNGIESIRVNEIAARTFFKNISVTKKENENEE
jgi:hypothetical protein